MDNANVNTTKTSIWAKLYDIFKKLFGISDMPPEIAQSDQLLTEWWSIYRCKPSWVEMQYVTTDGQRRKRDRLQLGMAKIACAEMAGLVLAEEPDVEAGDLVKNLIIDECVWDNERRSLEWQGALGAQVLKVCIGTEGGKPEVSLDFVKASNFIPLSWDNSEVTEGSFLDRRIIRGKPYVRIESHKLARDKAGNLTSGYEITNKVYDEKTQLEAPLTLFGEGILPSETIGVDMPLFAYIRNPEANNIDPESPTGIALFANAIDTIKAIDVAFDQFYSDIELGGRRIALPGSVFRKSLEVDPSTGKSKMVSYFDPSDRVFMRLEGDDAENFKPVDLTYDIRSEQFTAAIQTLLDIFAFQIGFDAGYFSFDGASVKTATEVISDNSHTFKTMQGFRENLDKGLKHVFAVVNKLGKLYQIEGASDKEITITWDDSVIEDRNSKAKYWTDLFNNKLVDRVTAIQKIHGSSEEDAQAMADKIGKETATVTASSIFGTGV